MKKLGIFVILLAVLLACAVGACSEIVASGSWDEADSGTVGKWTLDDQGVLTIDCVDFSDEADLPSEIDDAAEQANTIRFGPNVEKIYTAQYYWLKNITRYEVDGGNPYFSGIDSFLCSKDGTECLRCPPGAEGSITIPAGVKTMAFDAMYECRYVTEVIFPDSLEVLKQQSMHNCDGITALHIPKNLHTIANSAINCSNLQSFTVDEENETFTAVDGVLLTKNPYAVYYCPRAKSGEFNAPAVTEVASNAFRTQKLTCVTFTDGLAVIRRSAFEYSTIQEIHLPATLTDIEENAFSRCDQLTAVYFGGTTEAWENVRIANGNGLLQFNTIHCADGDYPPQPISGTLGNGVTYTLTPEGDLTISGAGDWDSYAFRDNKRLLHVTLESGVTEIGWSAFEYCDNLESITIPDTVTEIKYRAFDCCFSLRSITVPASVTAIGREAFNSCGALRNVYFGGTMEAWNSMVPVDENSSMLLSTVHCSDGDIPPAYTTSDSYRVKRLTDTVYQVNTGNGFAFAGTGAVPEGSIHNYYGPRMIDVMEGITSIGNNSFSNVELLTTVYLPASLQEIGDNVLANSNDLEHVYYAGTRKQWKAVSIGSGVNPLLQQLLICADDGQRLKLILPAGVVSIEAFAFEGIGAEIVDIPVTCQSIGDGAFRNCTQLSIVYLPHNAILGEGVFEGCPEDVEFIYK